MRVGPGHPQPRAPPGSPPPPPAKGTFSDEAAQQAPRHHRRHRRRGRCRDRARAQRLPEQPRVLLFAVAGGGQRGAHRPHVPARRHGHQRQPAARRAHGALSRHRHRADDSGALPRHPSGPVQGRQRRRRARPGRRRRRVRRARGARQARRELHAARSRRRAEAGRRDQPEVVGHADQGARKEMIPELGQVALLLALAVALIQGTLPLVGAARGRADWMALARPAAQTQFMLVAFAFIALMSCFVRNDFSLLYVASHSNSTLPLAYRIAGVWGGHEGSLLLWLLMLVVWMFAVAQRSRHLPAPVIARILAVMALIVAGFLLFMLPTSTS